MTIQEIKKALPWGAQTKISIITGHSVPHISKIIAGKTPNSNTIPAIVKAASKIIAEHKAQMKEAFKEVEQAVNA